MLREEWDALFETLMRTRDLVAGWTPTPPEPQALRCEHSRHRTLAHLRAAQEQWLPIVNEFLARDNPNVTVLHPWRKFDQSNYAEVPWDEHLAHYLADRAQWLALRDIADWNRGGKWNRKHDTVGGLTARLAGHEAHHVNLFN